MGGISDQRGHSHLVGLSWITRFNADRIGVGAPVTQKD